MSEQSRLPSPWGHCHNDHETFNIEVNTEGLVVERPYLTLLIDPATKGVLDYWLQTELLPSDHDQGADD